MAVGNIEKRGVNSYRLTVSGGSDANGKRIKYQKTIKAKSDREAGKALALFIADIEAGKIQKESQPHEMTFAEFTTLYLQNYAKTNLSGTTVSEYKRILDVHLLPRFGARPLNSIKPLDALTLYGELEKDGARIDGKPGGYSPRTIHRIHELLRSMFELAFRWELINSNPIARVTPPKVGRAEVEFLTLEQAKTLYERVGCEDSLFCSFVRIAMLTGLRRSEMLGLTWGAIDFERREMHVSAAVVYVPGVGLVQKDPKTDRSVRTIYLTDGLLEELDGLLLRRNALFPSSQINSQEYIFVAPNGVLLHPDTISGYYRDFIARNPDLPNVTLHGLRHTAATLMLYNGVDIETVSRVLGHASSTTTSNYYLHSADESKRLALQGLDAAIKSR